MRYCSCCETSKDNSDFYLSKNGSYSTYCRHCSNAKSRGYYHLTQEQRLKKMKEWRDSHREEMSQSDRERRSQPKHRERHAKRLKRWREENKEHVYRYNRSQQVKARGKVNKLVRKGTFPPANSMVCDICQEAQAAEWHHHKGYDGEFATDVIAACNECHGREHRK